MHNTSLSPFMSGSVAAVIYAVIYFLTGGRGSGLVVGSILVGAITTAIVIIVRAVMGGRART